MLKEKEEGVQVIDENEVEPMEIDSITKMPPNKNISVTMNPNNVKPLPVACKPHLS